MQIEVTEYRREDGVTMFKTGDVWVIRKIHGPAWFWDPATEKWVISVNLTTEQIRSFGRPLSVALAYLERVSKNDS